MCRYISIAFSYFLPWPLNLAPVPAGLRQLDAMKNADEAFECWHKEHLWYVILTLLGLYLFLPTATLGKRAVYTPGQDMRWIPLWVRVDLFARSILLLLVIFQTNHGLEPEESVILSSPQFSVAGDPQRLQSVEGCGLQHFGSDHPPRRALMVGKLLFSFHLLLQFHCGSPFEQLIFTAALPVPTCTVGTMVQ